MQDVWDRLGCLAAATHLAQLNLFGLDDLNKTVPYSLPPFSSSITKLVLEVSRHQSKAGLIKYMPSDAQPLWPGHPEQDSAVLAAAVFKNS